MKYLIASDIHGSMESTLKIIELANVEKADKIIILGDIYNHGPRNPLPEEYSPMQVASALNQVKNKLIVLKGNCDSVVDTYISEFDFNENLVLVENGKSIFLSHGHVYNKDAMPKTNYNAVIYGHFHKAFIERVNDTIIANPGSISLPKDGIKAYLIIENNQIILKDTKGELLTKELI